MPKAEDGTNPEVHIWRIAPTRRDFFGFLGWGAVLTSIGIGSLAFVRFMYPRVLFEPPTRFKLGLPSQYGPNSVSTKWIKAYRFWLVRFDDRFVALSATCTHLGCTPRYLTTEDKFKCPCHGSGFPRLQRHLEGAGYQLRGPGAPPARTLQACRSAKLANLVVDKSTGATFRIDKEQARRAQELFCPTRSRPYA